MRLGVHIPIAGGLVEAVARAARLSCTTMQIFSRSPRGGPARHVAGDVARDLRAQRQAHHIEPLVVHGPYIMNLASPDAAMWARSVALFQDEYARATQLGARYLVAHVGSHRGHGEMEGIGRVATAISQTLDRVAPGVTVLLENTAGSGQGIGYRFAQLAAIRSAVRAKAHVGVCLDTAHLFAAGYPIHTPEGLEDTLAEFDRTVGFEHLRLIHLNDSKVPFGSRVDRHWHIGHGHIGREAFRRIVNHPALHDLPFILETPKTTERDDRRNLATVRALVSTPGQPRRARPIPAAAAA